MMDMNIIGSAANVVGYGHLGDGNLHLNISVPQYDNTVTSSFLIKEFSRVCYYARDVSFV